MPLDMTSLNPGALVPKEGPSLAHVKTEVVISEDIPVPDNIPSLTPNPLETIEVAQQNKSNETAGEDNGSVQGIAVLTDVIDPHQAIDEPKDIHDDRSDNAPFFVYTHTHNNVLNAVNYLHSRPPRSDIESHAI